VKVGEGAISPEFLRYWLSNSDQEAGIVVIVGGGAMGIRDLFKKQKAVVVAICLFGIPNVAAAESPALTKDQIKEFLLTAKIIAAKKSTKGITQPLRLTLSDGKLTHDASYQRIDEHKTQNVPMAFGRSELVFVDSYKYNIAAYALAEMLGIEDMLPVYVERKYQGEPGSLSWWLPAKMDEADRKRRGIDVPDLDAWNNQMYRIRVFDQLIYDNDANLTNVLIGEDWKIWRIDFTRAFRPYKDLRDPNDLVRCERNLLEKLKALDGNLLAERTKRYLTTDEVKAVMARRDKIVARFQQLAVEKGETVILY
jgi:hypothetical protein